MSQMKVRQGIRHAFASLALLLMAGCGTATLSKVDAEGNTQSPVFPAIADASRPDGRYVNSENFGKVASGMTKAQIRELIGPPQFREGMVGVREWDYLLKFDQSRDRPEIVCQFKVLFDKRMIARSFFFMPESCAKAAG